MPYNNFVLPFSIGVIVLFATIIWLYISWAIKLPKRETKAPWYQQIISFIKGIGEIISECLIHRKIFKHNILLGYMHMSIAFGWFLLIVIGHIESILVSSSFTEPLYYSIFLNYFSPDRSFIPGYKFFSFTMDFLLAAILLGILLALIKRLRSKLFGMRKTSKLRGIDKTALYSLWLIFPLRLIAESLNANVHGTGGFLTASTGQFLSIFLPTAKLEIYAWWAYSFALGIFFVVMPWSRYSHIITEIFLIIVRRLGFKPCYKTSGYTMFDIYSCSRCGICIDSCQLNILSTERNGTVPAHYIYDIRAKRVETNETFNCLACGRCEEACPVGVKSVNLRIGKRHDASFRNTMTTDFIPEQHEKRADIAYFSGCMGKLTPSVIQSMIKIFETANETYIHIDEEKGICCGRPMLLSGQIDNAFELIKLNKKQIEESGVKTLVTSCPICLKTFKEDYQLPIEVIHHSEYIDRLIKENKLKLSKTPAQVAYHDPCELVREINITQPPRSVISKMANIYQTTTKDNQKLCCGASLAGIALSPEEKQKIAVDAIERITENQTDTLVTSCPLCKKTFGQTQKIQVLDIAELVAINLAGK